MEAKSEDRFLWKIEINDGYLAHRYEIVGTGEVSIQDIADAVVKRLDGQILSSEDVRIDWP